MENISQDISGIIREIGNSSQDGYVLIDKDYRIVWVNGFLENKGFKLENVKGTFYFKTFNHKDEIDENCSTVEAFMSGKVKYKTEKGKDGNVYYIASIPIKVGSNVEYVLEISKAKNNKIKTKAEKKDIEIKGKPGEDERDKLLNSEYTAKYCFDSIFFTDIDKKIICVNPAFENLKGYSMKEVIGDIPAIFRSKKTDQGIYREFWRALGKGKMWEQEFIGKRKDNSTYYSDMKIFPIKGELGTTKYFMVIEKDISDWKKSEEDLSRYKSFPDDSPDPVIQTDYDGNFIFIGEKNKSIFNELNIKNIINIIGRDVWSFLNTIKYKGKLKKIEKEIILNNKYYQVTAMDDPDIEAINFYFADITELKGMEEKIKVRNEELEKFNRLAVGRELKMIELKKRIKELEGKLSGK